MKVRVRFGWFVGAGLVLAVALVLGFAPRASSAPDGLERVALDQGFAHRSGDHVLAGSPVADYGVAGLGHEGLAAGLAGLAGVAVTFAAVYGLLVAMRQHSS